MPYVHATDNYINKHVLLSDARRVMKPAARRLLLNLELLQDQYCRSTPKHNPFDVYIHITINKRAVFHLISSNRNTHAINLLAGDPWKYQNVSRFQENNIAV